MTIQAYLINAASSKQRLNSSHKNIVEAGLNYERVSAIMGNELDMPYKNFSKWSFYLMQGRAPTLGEIGCYLSHIKAIKKFLESEYDYGLILEDDCLIDSNIKKVIAEAIDFGGFDMLRLETVNTNKYTKSISISNNYYLGVSYCRQKGACGYLINKKDAKKIVNKYLPIKIPYDIRFDLEYLDGFKTLGVTPSPIKQAGLDTQIQHNIAQNKFPKYRYFTVLPVRSYFEISRFFGRLYQHICLMIRVK